MPLPKDIREDVQKAIALHGILSREDHISWSPLQQEAYERGLADGSFIVFDAFDRALDLVKDPPK